MDIIVAVLLEKTTRRNSGNSGLPPSVDFGACNDRNKKNAKGAEKRGKRLDNSRIEKQTRLLSPQKCLDCGTDLENGIVIKTEERSCFEEDGPVSFKKYKISQYPEEDWADFISSKVIKKDGPNFGCFLENQTGII